MTLFDRVYRPEAKGRPIVVLYTGAAEYPETLTGKDEEHARRIAAFLEHGPEALHEALRTLEGEGYAPTSTTVRALRAALGEP